MADMVELSEDSTGKVLVVDDDARNRKLLRDLLSARGHQVLEASNGEDALQMAARETPDVVLLDVMMPGLDGFEVCRKIRELPDAANVPVILVTALTDRNDRLRGIEAGANDFLVKPIDSRDLVLRVRNAVHMKRLYDTLRDNYARLRDLEKLRDDLVHWVVHDMKNPMGAISGHLELLLMVGGDRLDEEQKGFIAEAFGATQQLLKMANMLLDVSQLEAKSLPLQWQPCILDQVSEAVLKDLKPRAADRNIHVHVAATGHVINADQDLLLRILSNLIENGIKYIPRGGTIDVTFRPVADGMRCEVADDGPGIPPEYQGRIFEKFGQVEIRRERRMHTTGLGLAFCKLAVEAHGGRIGVISTEGQKGSVFWFEIPFHPPADVEETASTDNTEERGGP